MSLGWNIQKSITERAGLTANMQLDVFVSYDFPRAQELLAYFHLPMWYQGACA